MPTSSQALLLKASPDGASQLVFGRRFWQPELSERLSAPQTIIGPACLHDRDLNRRNADQRPRSNLPDIDTRALTARTVHPNNNYPKMDFSSLTGVLKISGIHGRLAYDYDSHSFKWQIHEYPYMDQVSTQRRAWSLTGLPLSKERERHVVLSQRTNHFVDFNQLSDEAVVDEVKRGNRMTTKRITRFVKCNPSTNDADKVVLTKADKRDASYFKLIRNDDGCNTDDTGLYRLVQCSSEEAGSFRLTPTAAKEVGEYQLVPHEGYDAGDFRIVQSSSKPGHFVILQADTSVPGQYKPVVHNKSDNQTEFRYVQAKLQEKHVWNQRDARKLAISSESYQPVDRYTFFDDIMEMTQYEKQSDDAEMNPPDIQYLTHAQWTHTGQSLDTKRDKDTDACMKTDSSSCQQTSGKIGSNQTEPVLNKDASVKAAEGLRGKYLNNNGAGEVEMFQKLAQIGGKGTREMSGRDPITGDLQNQGQNWESQDFDQWSRTRDVKHAAVQMSQQTDENDHESRPIDKRQMWLEQISASQDYKTWRKKKIDSIRMRALLPPSDRKAVCVQIKDSSITHERLKEIIEKQTNSKLVNLQFDPISVHLQDSDAKCQWILRFSEESVCDLLIISGLKIDDTTYRVRRFDDVMKEEFEAHKFYTIMKELKERKTLKSSGEKKLKDKHNKKMKGAHTQTTPKLSNITLQDSKTRT